MEFLFPSSGTAFLNANVYDAEDRVYYCVSIPFKRDGVSELYRLEDPDEYWIVEVFLFPSNGKAFLNLLELSWF